VKAKLVVRWPKSRELKRYTNPSLTLDSANCVLDRSHFCLRPLFQWVSHVKKEKPVLKGELVRNPVLSIFLERKNTTTVDKRG